MPTYVLGISCYYHDASATLLKDGAVVAAVEEERFTRRKHDFSFPINAITYCFEAGGIGASDLAAVAFYEKPLLKFERILYQHLEYFPWSYKTWLSAIPSWLTEKLRVPRTIRHRLGWRGPIFFIEHHLAHAASAFLVSPFNEAAIVTIDGVGEWTCAAIGRGKEHQLELIKEIRFPHSLGLLYSTITAYLGFTVNNSEYKVMGLAAWGDMDRTTNPYYPKLKRVIDLKEDGSFRLDMGYFAFGYADHMPSAKLCSLLDGPITPRGGEISLRHKHIAAAVQLICEDVMFAMLREAQRLTKSSAVALAGGVALNSVANGKILQHTPFKQIWVQPNASDGGTSMGAASYVYHQLLGQPRAFELTSAYLGPEFASTKIKSWLNAKQITYQEIADEEELLNTTAKLIAQGSVVGWFQGRMEWGPRALGARSILADPRNPNARDILNEKVKHRERFRPFAPAVCAEDALTFFECDQPLPKPCDFMLMVYPVRRLWRKKIPAVTHVDGSGRLQTVHRADNSRYYDLIKAFGRETGIPMIINTSFNIRGEPIVCTPAQAYRCMMGTGIDTLVIDRFIVHRQENLQDSWDSESLAND